MPTTLSPLAQIDAGAQLGTNVSVGPFCLVGPNVVVGDGSVLESHVVLTGNTQIGTENRFSPYCVIGGEPQDKSYRDTGTRLVIGDNNFFREGVTVNRGSEKEDRTTWIGDRNLLMANSHVAHNCRVHNDVILVNGVLLGGHVHVHDRAIVSGNSVVHHFSTLGTLSFISGGCRVPHDVPPYMLAAGSDNPSIKTLNTIGMRRAGISDNATQIIRKAYKLHFRERRGIQEVRRYFEENLEDLFPIELTEWLSFIEKQNQGHMLRARDPYKSPHSQALTNRKAA
ncbi:MAG: acyl-[acyl-carrier-protein]--UDP-N-acetylglucosamine O-acyltransferase [Planctomycetaceae bacterium]|jgi:UDP-N-acetylglucosamine acyltransferase|nr:acyl-[acyl-carrier-protein]--UDP-N-acetylglucosamine O-acyltransferase [Planctomycetaceae bacterium]